MIVKVDLSNIHCAAEVHSISWKESHKSFCSKGFIDQHTIERQMEYLLSEMNSGKSVYMLISPRPVGIISVNGCLIENLYVLPDEERKGYGSMLLHYAISECSGTPSLWILRNNIKAHSFYIKNGFRPSGRIKMLSDSLFESEMIYYLE